MSSITQKVAELLSISVNLNIIMQAALNRIIVCEYQDVMKCREPKWLQISLFSGNIFIYLCSDVNATNRVEPVVSAVRRAAWVAH